MTIQARRDVFQAIADPTRRDILNLIARQSLNLNAIAEQFDVSRPAISQHIKILTECGLIIIREQGRERYCELQPQKLEAVADWLKPFHKRWEHHFDKLDIVLRKMKPTKKTKK